MIIQKILHRPRTIVNHITLEVGEELTIPYRWHSRSKIACLVGAVLVDGEDRYYEGSISVDDVELIKNVGKIPAELLEIRTGSYLGDDDIE